MNEPMPLSEASLPAQQGKPRFVRVAGPLLLYLLIGLGILWPYRSGSFRGAGDLAVVMSLTAEADYALRDGQLPIRVAPHLLKSIRYPVFQYYGNFPYTLTGLLSMLGAGPYGAWKIVTLASLVAAGYFTLSLSRTLWRQYSASVVAGAVFMTAPYLLTDINARGAFTEMIALNLLPAAFYFSLRCLRSRRWKYIIFCGVAWALIALTHNITFLYGVGFAVIFFMPLVFSRKGPLRVGRIVLAAALCAALVLWYVVPQFMTLDLLMIHQGISSPFLNADLTPLGVLLAPVLTNTLAGASAPGLGLQVGWPILAGVAAALAAMWRWKRGDLRRRYVLTLAFMFFLAFFIAWSPFDFWAQLPTVLWFVQFPYRLLMFVVLCGSLLTGGALAALFRRKMGAAVIVGALALLGMSASSYVPRRAPLERDMVRNVMKNPDVVNLGEYLPTAEVLAARAKRERHPSDADPANLSWPARVAQLDAEAAAGRATAIAPPQRFIERGRVLRCRVDTPGPTRVELPALYYPEILDVRVDGRRVGYGNAGRFVALRVGPGRHEISVRFAGTARVNLIGALAWGGLAAALLLALLARLGPQLRQAGRWLARTPRTIFPPKTALAGFAALVLFAWLPMLHPLAFFFDHSPRLQATATSSARNEYLPDFAFDDDPQTDWIAGDFGPNVLTARFSRPAVLHGVVLDSRLTQLYEDYTRVGVRLFEAGRQVYSGQFDFPQAAHEAHQAIDFPAVRADRIEFDFSDPNVETLDGRRVRVDQVRPGYSEIHLLWN